MGKVALWIGGCAMAIIAFAAIATRIPAVEDRLFERALAENFAPRAAALWERDGLNVFFCGTGSPLPSKKRAQVCTAVFAKGVYYLVDAGTGSWENIQGAGIPGERLGGVFLTHLHSDHIGDIGEADLGSWVTGRASRLRVTGPTGVDGSVRVFV